MPAGVESWSRPILGKQEILIGNNVVSSNPATAEYRDGTRRSVNTPGFSTGAAYRAGLPFNIYGFNEITRRNWQGWQKNQHKVGTYNDTIRGVVSAFNEGPEGYSGAEIALILDEVNGKVLGRMKDQVANWLENAATIRQSVEMVTSRTNQIGKALAALKRGNMGAAAAALGISPPAGAGGYSRQYARNRSKALANGWLELQYGWLPLLGDIYSTAQYLDAFLKKKEPIQRVSAKITRQKERSQRSEQSNYTLTLDYTAKLEVKCILYYKVTNQSSKTLAQMGISNPAALAWELVRWSFVIDWLLPIGSWISNLDAANGTRFIKGGVTIAQERKVIGLRVYDGHEDAGVRYSGSVQGSYKDFAVNRNPIPAPPKQLLPHFKDPFSTMHLANAMALLRQQKR